MGRASFDPNEGRREANLLGEIATAFVRIRPDTRGFQSEAEGSLRGAFSRLARVAAGAFAVKETIDFGADIVRHAADVQKQIEVVKAEFGAAADEVLKFNNTTAEGLGISAHLADTTAARFGILFKNLGIGTDQAGKMTIGFEQLAGSLGAIRGLDPSTVLRNIPLAVAGNLRSLKQLGIATDQTQLKIAAFKLGLTSSITEALTPAQRAQAIYAIATAHLGEFLQQAAAHSGDFINRTRVLSAALDNAKDRLGQGLLPVATAFAVFLSNVLPTALAGAGRLFHDLAQEIRGIAGIIGPALAPIVSEVRSVGSALSQGGISAAIAKIRSDFASLSPAARGVVAAIGLISAAFAVMFASAAPTLSLVVAVVGIAVAFREAYDRSQSFHDAVVRIGTFVQDRFVPIFRGLERFVAPAFAALGRAAESAVSAITRAIESVGPRVGDLIERFRDLSPVSRTVVAGVAAIGLAIAALTVGPIVAVAVAVAGIALAMRELGTKRLDALVAAIEGLRAPAVRVAAAIRDGIGKAIDFVGRHKEAFEILAGSLAGAAAGFVALRIATTLWAAATRIATGVMILFDAALDANPISIIVIAVAALVGALVVLYTRSATVRRILNGLFDGVSSAARAALPALEAVGRILLSAVRGVAGFVTGTIVPVVRTIATAVAPVLADLATTIAEGFRAALAVVRTFITVAVAVIRPFAEIIIGVFRAAVDGIKAVWGGGFGAAVVGVLRAALSTAVGIVRAGLRILRGVFQIIGGLLTGDWKKVWDGIKNIVGGSLDGIKALVSGEKDAFVAVFTALWKAVERVSLEGLAKVVELLAKVPTSFTVAGKKIGFTNPFKSVAEGLKATIAGLKADAVKATTEIPAAVADAAAKANAGAARSIHESARKAVDDAVKSTADVVGQGADSAEAGRAAQTAAAAAARTVAALNENLQKTVQAQDAGIAKARAKLRTLGQQIADAVKQEAQDVRDAVTQAEQNLNSIGASLSSSIGAILDKPIQDAQASIARQQNQQTLEALRRSVVLPGGGRLSTDPQKALQQLRALADAAGNINKGAINSFITQYQSAVLAVRQDQANVTKEGTTQRIADLADSFNRGQITLAQFKKGILRELTKDHVTYRKAGALLGSAFANGFQDQVKGLFAQAAAIAATPAGRRSGITGTEVAIVRPLETLRKDQSSIAALTHKKMDAQTALQSRIAKAAEKTAALQAKVQAVKINPDAAPSSTQKNPGKATKTAADLANTTG